MKTHVIYVFSVVLIFGIANSRVTLADAPAQSPLADEMSSSLELAPGTTFIIQENQTVKAPSGTIVTDSEQNEAHLGGGRFKVIVRPGAKIMIPGSATGSATNLVTTNQVSKAQPFCLPFIEKNPQLAEDTYSEIVLNNQAGKVIPNQANSYTACLNQPNAACLFEELLRDRNLKSKDMENPSAFFNWSRQTMGDVLDRLGCATPNSDSNSNMEMGANPDIEKAAIALARAGKPTEALQLAADYLSIPQTLTDLASIAENFQSTTENNQKRYLLALLGLAEGRTKRSDRAGALQTLAEINVLTKGKLAWWDRNEHEAHLNLAMRVAIEFAKLEETKSALQAFASIPDFWMGPDGKKVKHFPMFEATKLAISFCGTNQRAAGMGLLAKLRRDAQLKENANNVYVLTGLAEVERACLGVEKAKLRFVQAKKAAEATPNRVGCLGELTDLARRNVREAMLYAGLAEPDWQQESYDSRDFMLIVELQHALNGHAQEVLEWLDEFRPNYQRYELIYTVIRAKVLSLLGRIQDAVTELVRAKDLVFRSPVWGKSLLYQKFSDGRSWGEQHSALLEIARIYSDLQQNDTALTVIRYALTELFNTQLSHSTSNNSIDRYRYEEFVKAFDYSEYVSLLVQVGAEQTAQILVNSALEPFPNRYTHYLLSEDLQSKILAEAALSRFKETGDSSALAAISKVSRASHRLALWHEAIKGEQEDSGALNALLQGEIQKIPAAFAENLNSTELRQLIREYSFLLRSDHGKLSFEQQSMALQQLATESRRFSSRDAKENDAAKALCELGFTANKLKQLELAIGLFDEGLTKINQIDAHNYHSYIQKGEPSAIGACAYWLNAAGETDRAQTELQQYLKRFWINMSKDKSNSSYFLYDLALVYGEYQYGEVRWEDGTIFEH